jgi:hypothetical protein
MYVYLSKWKTLGNETQDPPTAFAETVIEKCFTFVLHIYTLPRPRPPLSSVSKLRYSNSPDVLGVSSRRGPPFLFTRLLAMDVSAVPHRQGDLELLVLYTKFFARV